MNKRSVSFATKARAAVVLAVFGSGAQSVLAQDNVTIDARQCQKLESPDARLECYERQVNAASAQKSAGAPTAPAPNASPPPSATSAPDAHSAAPGAAAPAAAAAATPVESAHATSSTPSPAAASGPANQSSASGNAAPDIVGTVKTLSTTVPNAWLITLDNGQVWRQTFPEAYPLRPGQRVTLRPSRWGGAFRLTGDGTNGYIQVERVR